MPGIVELPTLEELKVDEVRLVGRTDKRGKKAAASQAWAYYWFVSVDPGLRTPPLTPTQHLR